MTSSPGQMLWMETSHKDVQSALRSWTNELERKGTEAIKVGLPAKILALNAMIDEGSLFHVKDNHLPGSELSLASPVVEAEVPSSGRKKRKVTNGKETVGPASSHPPESPTALGGIKNASREQAVSLFTQVEGITLTMDNRIPDVSSNVGVNSQYVSMRKHWEDLINITNDIKIYVNLLVPKIEDGDTFGVQVQEECLAELGRAQDSGYNLLDSQFKHHAARAKLASKLVKYPNIEDYQLALKEHDRKASYLIEQHAIDLRNIYTCLTDLLHKNIVKLTKPKGANSEAMY